MDNSSLFSWPLVPVDQQVPGRRKLKRPSLRSATASMVTLSTLMLVGCGGGGAAALNGNSNQSGTTSYTVSANAGAGGSITPTSATVASGGTTTFTATPGSGYAISSVSGCGGSLAGNIYATGPVTADCTVTASFVAQYTVAATASSGGTITPASTMVDSGSTTTFTVTPSSGYVVSTVTGCSGSLSGSIYTTGTITGNCTVKASFVSGWTWVGGSNTANAAAVYGTKGVASASNEPGARDESVAWTDSSGNLWLFGGENTTSGTQIVHNDLWEYSPASGEWTWVGGSNTTGASGVYGTKGVAAVSNTPGSRVGAVTWTDASGELWLFGGFGYDSTGTFGDLNDLWTFSSASGEWTWVGGSNTANAAAVYGTKGVASASNEPGARDESVAWTDSSGNLWLFGGENTTSGTQVVYNDLWEYSPASGEWTWVGGSNTTGASGVYGTKNVTATSNTPGSRVGAVAWTDASGELWLFGGFGYDSTGTFGDLNDLWTFSSASGEWTWVGGSNTANAAAVYGTKGVAAASNEPGARDESVAWTDSSGNLWLFGGENTSFGTQVLYNDSWEYSPASGEWTWVGGSDITGASGVYGTKGVTATSNTPGSRVGAVGWTEAGGKLWLFGGFGYDSTGTFGDLNDLWGYSTQ